MNGDENKLHENVNIQELDIQFYNFWDGNLEQSVPSLMYKRGFT